MEDKPKIKNETLATDQEIADLLSTHIDYPCETELYDSQKVNIREFYIREAERIIKTFTDVNAKNALQAKIDQYKK